MKVNSSTPSFLTKIWMRCMLLVITFISLGFAPLNDEGYWARQLRLHGKMNLPVAVILQSKYTS
jgi:hypothetical protein